MCIWCAVMLWIKYIISSLLFARTHRYDSPSREQGRRRRRHRLTDIKSKRTNARKSIRVEEKDETKMWKVKEEHLSERVFFNYLVFLFPKQIHESLSRTQTLINIYSVFFFLHRLLSTSTFANAALNSLHEHTALLYHWFNWCDRNYNLTT